MSESIILKKNPTIEFQLLDTGFELIDGQTQGNTGFYSYSDLQSIDLRSVWFARLAKWLRAISWILNGVPLFPDAKSYNKSNLIIRVSKAKLGIWLTDSYMAGKAKKIKKLLEEKAKRC